MVNIGRRISGGTIWGNPVRIGRSCVVCGQVHKVAGETLPCYRKYLWGILKDTNYRNALAKLKGQTLYCPGCGVGAADCHGRILEKAIKWVLENGKTTKV